MSTDVSPVLFVMQLQMIYAVELVLLPIDIVWFVIVWYNDNMWLSTLVVPKNMHKGVMDLVTVHSSGAYRNMPEGVMTHMTGHFSVA